MRKLTAFLLGLLLGAALCSPFVADVVAQGLSPADIARLRVYFLPRGQVITAAELASGAVTPAKLDRAYLPASESSNLVTQAQLAGAGFATEDFVTGQGYATAGFVTGQGFATEDFVTGQGYLSAESDPSVAGVTVTNEQVIATVTNVWVYQNGLLKSWTTNGVAVQ